jgi:hypothetical protein
MGNLLASKGLSGAAPVLEEYGLSCENDVMMMMSFICSCRNKK